MTPRTMRDEQARLAAQAEPHWIEALRRIAGREHVLTAFPERLAYARDRLPLANLRFRSGLLPAGIPAAVVQPGSYAEVQDVVRLAVEHAVTLVPWGLGSGVLGGALPDNDALVVDLRRLDRVLAIDRHDGLVTAQAGTNGAHLEAALEEQGLTCGHYPQSMRISTIGGWIASRGSGQASSRYGSIEEMVVGMKVVLPDAALLDIRPAPRRSTGPGLIDLFIGAEGTLGIVVEATLRAWPQPQHETLHAVAFPDVVAGLEAFRRIAQSGLRPIVARLYDEAESARRTGAASPFDGRPCLAILAIGGIREVAEAEARAALAICATQGGVVAPPEPAIEWHRGRFGSVSSRQLSRGRMMDTVEVAARWSALPGMHEEMKASALAVNRSIEFGAHWSHIYPDGACMYMSVVFPETDPATQEHEHAAAWDAIMRVCLARGGTISHHHGIGSWKARWLAEELGVGQELLQQIKSAVDPGSIMNPGKLGLG